MSSDWEKEVYDPQPQDEGPRTPTIVRVEGVDDIDKQSSDNMSVTVYDQSDMSPRSGITDVIVSDLTSPTSGTIDIEKEETPMRNEVVEVDTSKVYVDVSHLEAGRPLASGPEIVRHSVGLEPISNFKSLDPPKQIPTWMTKRRWFILGCAILILLIIAIIVIGLVAGLVVARRGGDEGSSSSSAAMNSACGNQSMPVHRQLLAAAAADSGLFIFARGLDDDIWYRTLDGADSTWTGQWGKWVQMRERFAGPPTAIDWAPQGTTRIHVFAPVQDEFNVMGAAYENGSLPNSWVNLGERTASTVALCKVPAGFAGAGSNQAERIDQWVVNRQSREPLHNFWNHAINGFQEPASNTEWEGSPASQQPSSSSLAAVCRKNDPIHTILMYENRTGTVRFRHYSGLAKSWSALVDIGGRFKGDPVIVPVNETYFAFFGIHIDGDIATFNWTNASGIGYRPALTTLGGNLTSVPSAVVTSIDPLRIDVVALGVDGNYQHKAFRNGKWSDDWENLGISGSSAPLLYQYEAKKDSELGGTRNRTFMAAIEEDNQLWFADWETTTNVSWKELVATWATAGGKLTTKSMCD